jgi:tRNA(fMet)-specific endonuclease VapC
MAGPLVILDTCILIEIQRGNQQIIDRVYDFERSDLCITPIVIAEFYRGSRNKAEFIKCRKLVNKFRVLALDQNVAMVFGEFFEQYSISHRPSIPDMLIAATAIHYNVSLYTLNVKDFNFIKEISLLTI